jgi:hypothetical protein
VYKILKEKDVTYAMVIMDKKIDDLQDNGMFAYERLQEKYQEILKIREVDYHIHSIYGFLFLKIQAKKEEWFQKILEEDFDQFLV